MCRLRARCRLECGVVVLATTVLAGVMLLYSLLFLVAPATVLSADTLKVQAGILTRRNNAIHCTALKPIKVSTSPALGKLFLVCRAWLSA